MVIYNDTKGENQAFLYQVAYDRFKLKDKQIDFINFNGCLLKADWNDTLQYAEIYKDGKKSIQTIQHSEKNARISGCGYVQTGGYQTWGEQSCGSGCTETVIYYHRQYTWMCNNGGYYPGEWQLPPPDGSGGGGGGVTQTTNFNPKRAICNVGSDRTQMLDNLGWALDQTGLINGIGGFTWAKGDALLRSVGANIDEFLPSMSMAGRTFGVVGGSFSVGGVLISGSKLFIGVTDGSGWTWDDDGWDSVQLGLALAGMGLTLVGGGVIVAVASVVIGGVSIGLSMYTENQSITTKNQLRQATCN